MRIERVSLKNGSAEFSAEPFFNGNPPLGFCPNTIGTGFYPFCGGTAFISNDSTVPKKGVLDRPVSAVVRHEGSPIPCRLSTFSLPTGQYGAAIILQWIKAGRAWRLVHWPPLLLSNTGVRSIIRSYGRNPGLVPAEPARGSSPFHTVPYRVCLGDLMYNPPFNKYNKKSRLFLKQSALELPIRFERTTCSLRVSCSTS